MNEIVKPISSSVALVSPRVPITVRAATLADVPFIDRLQKKYGKALGYFPTKQFEGYVEMGGVLIAEEGPSTGSEQPASPVGYIISRDRYLKRDELGVIYQLCVTPGVQRKLVGASLVKEVFERSAYGCKLYCCWCAQDLDANYFWESLGFLPIAFRAGSTGKKRVHIFWQKRIGAGDSVTPYWYPFQTNAGAIRQDRIVFPIPPGVHWKDVQAVTLPSEEKPKLEDRSTKQIRNREVKIQKNAPGPGQVAIVVGGRIKYIDRPGYVAPEVVNEPAPAPTPAPSPAPTKARPKRTGAKIDAKYLAAARELRDRYLEQLNAGTLADGNKLLPSAKYEVSKANAPPESRGSPWLLEQAA